MTAAIRTVRPTDVPAIVALLNAAYAPNPAFEARFRRYTEVEPEGWVTIDGANGPIGVGGFVAFGRCAYIGLMGVAPEAQRRGLGAAIFEELLARCERRGCSLLLLDASDAGAPLYARYGFSDEGAVASYAVDVRTGAGTDDGGIETVDVDDPAVVREVVALDTRCYGARREALVTGFLGEHRGRVLSVRDGAGTLAGYCVAQPRSVGPCMATSPDAARALFARALSLPFAGPVAVLVSRTNADAVALMESFGGRPTRRWRHMRRGDPTQLHADWSCLYAKMSLAVG